MAAVSYAERKGLTVVGELCDDGVSAKNLSVRQARGRQGRCVDDVAMCSACFIVRLLSR
jgi:hypothetical protein